MRYSLFILFILLGWFGPLTLVAQHATGISYQAIVRTNKGTVTNRAVGVRVSLLQGSPNGNSVYTEIHSPTTDQSAAITLKVGAGSVESGVFSEIDWAQGPYFLKSEIDPEGGTNYTIESMLQLLSVPYALHSSRAGRSPVANKAEGLLIRKTSGSDTLYFGADSIMVVVPGFDSLNPPGFPQGYVQCDPANPTVIDTVMSATGRIWMDRNLGASRVAEGKGDTLAYGGYYQWGRFGDGHQCRNSDTTTILATTPIPNEGNAWDGKFIIEGRRGRSWLENQIGTLWEGVDAVNNPCPEGFRLPTETEWENEVLTWSPPNFDGAFNSPLKLPMPGRRSSINGQIVFPGIDAGYWVSSINGETTGYMYIFSGNALIDPDPNAKPWGRSVRCIKDE